MTDFVVFCSSPDTDETRSRATIRIKAHLEVLGQLIPVAEGEKPEGKAIAILSTMVGALTLSRVVNDPGLAQAFLDAAGEQVREAVAT